MKLKDLIQTSPGTLLYHSHYGYVKLKEVVAPGGSLFGYVIRPATFTGQSMLANDSGAALGVPLMEDSIRRIRPLTDKERADYDAAVAKDPRVAGLPDETPDTPRVQALPVAP